MTRTKERGVKQIGEFNVLKKLRAFWDRQKLKSKLLIIIIPASIFSSMLIMLLAYCIFDEYENKLYEVARQNLYMVVGKIEKELIEAENLGVDLSTNETLQKALKSEPTNIRTKRISMDYILMAQQVYKVLQTELNKNQDMISISIFVEDEWYYVGNANRSYDKNLLEMVSFDASRFQDRMFWCASEYPTDRLYGIRTIKDIYHGTFRNEAVLILEYDLKGSLNSLRQQSKDNSLMQNFAVYNGEEVIYSDIGLDSGMEWERDIDYKIVTADGKKYFASYMNESAYDWKYVFLVSYDDLFGAMWLMKYLFLAFAVCMVVISITYSQKLSKLLTDRFSWLISQMKTVQSGSFSVENPMSLYPQDEIDLICKQFEEMVADLDKLIQDNYVKQMLIKENQLKVLQNQINPHFLFNVLQTINWKAKENHQKEISEIAEALGKLLRYTLEEENDPVALEKEKRILKNYLFIQQVRYGERLTVNINIPEYLEQRLVPKLSLQNIVENSIKYALENMLKPCVIHVWAEEHAEDYCIFVEDNGPGIEGVSLNQTESASAEPAGENSMEKECAGLGIGLRNLQGRLRLLFPEGSGLQITNTGHGTLTVIVIRKPTAKGLAE